MLRGHCSDTHIDFGAANAQSRSTILREPPFRNIEPSKDLDSGDQRLGHYPERRRDCTQQAIDAHAYSQPGAERLDMNVACTQLHGALKQVIESTHHRRAASKIAQAVNVIIAVPTLAASGLRLRGLAAVEALEHSGNIFERGNDGTYRMAEDDLDSANRRGIQGISNRKLDFFFVGGSERKHHRFAQETPREAFDLSVTCQQVWQAYALQVPKPRYIVG